MSSEGSSVTDSIIATIADMDEERQLFLASRNEDESEIAAPFTTTSDQVGSFYYLS